MPTDTVKNAWPRAAYTASPNVAHCSAGVVAREELPEVGHQVELEALLDARQRHRAHAQRHEHDEQRDHHHLRHAFDAVFQARARRDHADRHDDQHVNRHLNGVSEKLTEHACDMFGTRTVELAHRAFHHEGEHPARHHRVEHHEQVVARKADPLEAMPLPTLGFEFIVAARDRALGLRGPRRIPSRAPAARISRGISGTAQRTPRRRTRR